MDEKALLPAVCSRLTEYGIAIKVMSSQPGLGDGDSGIDVVLELAKGSARARYRARITKRMTLSSAALRDSRGPEPILVIGEHIDSRSATAFRKAGLQYADAAGNAFIRFESVYVEVQGRRQRQHADALGGSSTRAAGNLFSTRRSQAIMALLTWPELWTVQVRDLAAAGGVSTGQAHDTLLLLEKAGLRARPSPDSRRQTELLEYWTAAYPTGLGPKLVLDSYSGDVEMPVKKSDPEQAVYLSGESASGVDLVRPATLTVYVANLDSKLPVVNRWRREPEVEPNVFVRRKFWTSPRPEEELPAVKGHNAPWPLVYADLMATGDARLAEVAQKWKARFVRSNTM